MRYVLVITSRYPISIRNDETPIVLFENGFFYNRVRRDHVDILKGNHYSGFKTIPFSFVAKKYAVVDPNVKVPMKLIYKTIFHNIVTFKFVPPNLGGDLPKPSTCAIVAYVQPVIPYFRPFKRPLNYLEYKKNFDLNVHVWVIKVVIKVNNGETVDDKITNLFNFTLRNNAFNWCNNYIQNNLDYRFVNLEQAFCRWYRIVQNDE